jgi:hypothetical protein
MNSNRTKYASAPTYGMQKRGYAKKQAAAQPAPTPDFSQQPALEAHTSFASFAAPNPFSPPQNAYSAMPVQPTDTPYFTLSPTAQPFPASPGNAPAYGAAPGANGYAGYAPPSPYAAVPGYGQPMGNIASAANPNAFSPRAQGFVPPAYAINGGAGPMSAEAASPQAFAGVPLGANGGLNAPPAGADFSGGPYPTAGIPASGFASNAPQSFGGSYPPLAMNGGGKGFSGQPYPGLGGAPASPTPKPPFDLDKWLKIILYGVLPVLFIPCVFVTHTFDFLRYAFIVLAVIALSVLWYRQSFSSALRTTLSAGYLALSVIVIALLVGGVKDVTTTYSGTAVNAASEVTAAGQATVTVSQPEAQETPAPVEDEGESEAEQRLATFMDYWSVNNFEQMANLVQPSWAAEQNGAAQALFTVISNRTPQDYTIESISGSAGDSSRTVTMSATIDKNNGKDPVRYRFMILMVNEDGEWYVDPNSLATNETADDTSTGEATTTQSLAPRMTVTPVPAADTKLYYNANGGSYYHIDPNCSAVNSKYLPMTSFLYSQLDDSPYNSLLPCLVCGAPTESLGDLASDTATPAP